jgi:hypothetical protein
METLAWFMVWGMAPVLSDFVGKSFQTAVLSENGGKEKVSPQKRRLIHGELVALEAEITDEQIGRMEDCCSLAGGGLWSCDHGWFESSYQSAKLHYRKWLPATPPPTTTAAAQTTAPPISPRAVVIYMHGISTHSGKAFVRPLSPPNDDGTTTTTGQTSRCLGVALLAGVLVQRHNMAVYAFDQYGHGLSEGARFWIPKSWTTNRDDYITFCRLVAAAHQNVPILYGLLLYPWWWWKFCALLCAWRLAHSSVVLVLHRAQLRFFFLLNQSSLITENTHETILQQSRGRKLRRHADIARGPVLSTTTKRQQQPPRPKR